MQIILYSLGAILIVLSFPAISELSLMLALNIFGSRKIVKADLPDRKKDIGKIAVLVPAYNEALHISRCVKSITQAKSSNYLHDVIVIADNCNDETAVLASAAGARVIERFDSSLRGKGAALHYAINILLQEDYYAFIVVDADSVVNDLFIEAMGANFASGKDALQCVDLALNVHDSADIRLINLGFLSMNVFRPVGRELIGSSTGIFGNGFGLTAKLLEQIPYNANSITEDMEYHYKLIDYGYRVHFVYQARVLADFPVTSEGIKTQRERWEGGRFHLQRKFFIPLLIKICKGRFRLFEPFMELMSLPLAYVVFVLAGMLLIPVAGFRIYAIYGILVIAFQTLLAVCLYGTKGDLKALFRIPAYLCWKLVHLPAILMNSRKNAQWIRTKRDNRD